MASRVLGSHDEFMADLKSIVQFLDESLNTCGIPDYPGALNGLQLQNNGEVTKVASAVDASLPVIRKAVEAGADLLIVHHGLFWQGAQRFVDAQYSKIKEAMDANLAIYSSHIPLDVHPEWGNNALLAKSIGLENAESYHDWKGILLGVKGIVSASLDELVAKVSDAVESPVHVCKGKSDGGVGVVGVITGGAGSEVVAMANQGIQTFITGEGPHWSFPLAEELGINVIYAGHYASETFGVRELSRVLEKKYELNTQFIHHPTGL